MRALATFWLTALLTACASSERADDIRNGVAGDEVNSICFTRQINSWQEFDDRSIILERGRNDYYKVDLAGSCMPRDAFVGLQFHSRSGICLNVGDEIDFPDDRAPSCTIRRIHEWLPAGQ